MTREEKNRRIAEGLGWKRTKTPTSYYWNMADGTPVGYDGSFDFYTDESANALVLEAMLRVKLDHRGGSFVSNGKPFTVSYWYCYPRSDRPEFTEDKDRKTAIADAYLKWLETRP